MFAGIWLVQAIICSIIWISYLKASGVTEIASRRSMGALLIDASLWIFECNKSLCIKTSENNCFLWMLNSILRSFKDAFRSKYEMEFCPFSIVIEIAG